MLAARTRKEGAESSLEMAFEARIGEIEQGWRRHLDEIVYPQGSEPGADPLLDTGEQPSPLDEPAPLVGEEKPSPLRLPREQPVDLHNLDLESDDRVDFDPEFEDPFEGEPRIRRGSGLRDPTGSDLDPPPDLDFGAPPEFGFENQNTSRRTSRSSPTADPVASASGADERQPVRPGTQPAAEGPPAEQGAPDGHVGAPCESPSPSRCCSCSTTGTSIPPTG